ncbi:Nitric oxide synthase, endothelial [Chionoecetes opilio]|uniref:Nitric oxide synthase, endothelial n=1 Tax=Chionoecetes opilio TaxID=41210 RepID=A0A8J4YCA8_CHIOP|nr:Nitric oxide synthase, endothelial [Chionoecetes opilio]
MRLARGGERRYGEAKKGEKLCGDEGTCTRNQCNGALMFPRKAGNEPRSSEEVLKLAKDFIDEYYQSIKRTQSVSPQGAGLNEARRFYLKGHRNNEGVERVV